MALSLDPTFDGQEPRSCSGTLISARWVITAAHCIERPIPEAPALDASQANWTIRVSPYGFRNPANGQAALVYGNNPGAEVAHYGRTYHHTFARSGRIPFYDGPESWSPGNPAPNRDRDLDIALIKLDERVPHPVGVPARIPGPGDCGDDDGTYEEGDWFAGRLVGFGVEGFEGVDPDGDDVSCPNDAFIGRRQKGFGFIDWTRVDGPDASTFNHVFTATGDVCTEMAGIGSGGDSGGSLYKMNSGYPRPLLCGVISGDGDDNQGTSSGVAYSNYHTAALDDPTNLLWIYFAGITDVDAFLDTHEPRGNDDEDGDGIADLWDNCPEDPNEYQLYQNNDPDFDGVGNDCEHCVGSDASDQLTNSNWEVEWILGIPQVRDGCDPTPVPIQTLDNSYGTLPSGAIPTPPVGYKTALRNWINVDTINIPSGSSATTGLRFCDCKDVVGYPSTYTEGGRLACRTQGPAPCTYSGTAYETTPSPWKPIKTQRLLNGTETWSFGGATGREWSLASGEGFGASWDFRALGSAVTTTSSSQKVKGILMATIRSVSQPIAGLSAGAIKDRAATLGTGDAYWSYVPIHAGMQWKETNEPLFCATCPQRARNPYFEISNPEWRVPIESASLPFGAPDTATVQHYEQAAAGTVRHVPASEPLAILAKTIHPGNVKARSVGIEGQAVTRVLNTDRLDALPVRASFSATGGPSAGASRGAAFSASKQRLYLVGGQQATGAPLNDGWFLDLETAAWRHFTFPAGEGVGAVFATTYRWQDQTIYFLDKSGTTLRLRRWNAQDVRDTGVVQTLATFPASWNPFAKVELLNTPSGDLMIVAWAGTGSEKTRVGRFTVSPARTVDLVALTKTTISLAGVPVVGATGYTMLRHGTGAAPMNPYNTSVTFASMPAPGSTDAPTLLPH